MFLTQLSKGHWSSEVSSVSHLTKPHGWRTDQNTVNFSFWSRWSNKDWIHSPTWNNYNTEGNMFSRHWTSGNEGQWSLRGENNSLPEESVQHREGNPGRTPQSLLRFIDRTDSSRKPRWLSSEGRVLKTQTLHRQTDSSWDWQGVSLKSSFTRMWGNYLKPKKSHPQRWEGKIL